MRYAAIDIGTNSCRLLIAEINNNRICTVYRDLQTTRLGEGVDASRNISPTAMQRTVDCLQNFQAKINQYEVSSRIAAGTSAVRDANNRDDFIKLVANECNLPVCVLDGKKEAFLSYSGVKKGLTLEKTPLVVDLGGGSTEFILEGKENCLLSLPVGAVRVTEAQMPVTRIASILSPIAAKKDSLKENPLVFVGGTAATLVAIKLSLEEYRSDLVHGQVLTRSEIADIYNMLERMPLNLRKRLPGLQPERADIIPGGVLIVLLILDAIGKQEIIVSESDILEGLIWKIAEDG